MVNLIESSALACVLASNWNDVAFGIGKQKQVSYRRLVFTWL